MEWLKKYGYAGLLFVVALFSILVASAASKELGKTGVDYFMWTFALSAIFLFVCVFAGIRRSMNMIAKGSVSIPPQLIKCFTSGLWVMFGAGLIIFAIGCAGLPELRKWLNDFGAWVVQVIKTMPRP